MTAAFLRGVGSVLALVPTRKHCGWCGRRGHEWPSALCRDHHPERAA